MNLTREDGIKRMFNQIREKWFESPQKFDK